MMRDTFVDNSILSRRYLNNQTRAKHWKWIGCHMEFMLRK